MDNRKCICSHEFEYGLNIQSFSFKSEKNRIYEYRTTDGVNYIKDKDDGLYYPILCMFFKQHFMDIEEMREKKINEILC